MNAGSEERWASGEGRNETPREQAGGDNPASRICSILHILRVAGIGPKFHNPKSLVPIRVPTPPMPPPLLSARLQKKH